MILGGAILGFDKDLLEIVISSLSAIGTLAAVVVSLNLARKDKPILSVKAAIKLVYRENQRENAEEKFVLSGTNVGVSPVIIQGVYWEIGRGKNKITFISAPGFYTSMPGLGSAIAHGQQVTMVFGVDAIEDIGQKAALSALEQRTAGYWFTKHLSVGIYTTVLSFKTKVTGDAYERYAKALDAAFNDLHLEAGRIQIRAKVKLWRRLLDAFKSQ